MFSKTSSSNLANPSNGNSNVGRDLNEWCPAGKVIENPAAKVTIVGVEKNPEDLEVLGKNGNLLATR